MSHKGAPKLFPCDGLPLPGIKPPDIYGHTGSALSWIRPSAVANLLQLVYPQGRQNRHWHIRRTDILTNRRYRQRFFKRPWRRFRSRLVHDQGGRVQGRNPKAQTADILSQETGAHFPFRIGSENDAGDKTLRAQPKKGSLFQPAARTYPRPKRGILVAMTVMKGTLDSSGSPAI